MKIVLVANTAWSLFNFRRSLIVRLVDLGHDVVTVAPPDDEHQANLESLGARFVPVTMDNKGTHPGRDVLLYLRLFWLFRRESPGLVISFTIKPVIFAGLAAASCSAPGIGVVTGLGSVFLKDNLLTRLVENLYRFSLARAAKVFVLNQDDMRVFRERRLAPAEKLQCLNGEGIDLRHFAVAPTTGADAARPFRFLLAARMLWDKGIGEYVEAARKLRADFPSAEFCLLGFLDVQNPTAISREQMEQWDREGTVRYLGQTSDIRPELARADAIVLPSYREGISRFLLEAAAMGRPIVATDVTGCREIVDDGTTGYLCRVRDADDLAAQMRRMLELPAPERAEMGRRGRLKVEREFDEQVVIQKYIEEIDRVKPTASPARVSA